MMSLKKKGLGRGLDALLSDNSIDSAPASGGGITMLRAMDIEPNIKQARKRFDKEQLDELAESISRHGVLQRITVRRKDNGFYEIIAGERRWRACKIAGVTDIPVIIKDVSEGAASEISLIENLQREDLNPVEEANGYKALTEEFNLTQEEAARRVGKSRAAVANIMRILKLPGEVLALVENGELSYGHARTLLPLCESLPDEELLKKAQYIVKEGLSVRQTEALVKQSLEPKPPVTEDRVADSYYKRLESRASSIIGRRVAISRSDKGSGKLLLSYADVWDLELLLKSLCGEDMFEAESN